MKLGDSPMGEVALENGINLHLFRLKVPFSGPKEKLGQVILQYSCLILGVIDL